MSQLLSNMFLLMIAALIIGWLIGWFIRRSATRNRYINKIDDLSNEDKSFASELHINSENYEDNIKALDHTKNRLSFTKQQAKDYLNQSIEVKSNMNKLNISQKEIEANFVKIDDKIKNSSNELENLNLQKDEILKSKEKITQYEQNINIKNKEIGAMSEKVSLLINERDSLNTKLSNVNEKISLKEQEINAENDKIKVIEDEFASKTLEIKNELEESRIKALNYQYAVNYVNEKIDAKEPISFDTIDKIISKNEEKGLFTNLTKKLFGKSVQYIKGGK